MPFFLTCTDLAGFRQLKICNIPGMIPRRSMPVLAKCVSLQMSARSKNLPFPLPMQLGNLQVVSCTGHQADVIQYLPGFPSKSMIGQVANPLNC